MNDEDKARMAGLFGLVRTINAAQRQVVPQTVPPAGDKPLTVENRAMRRARARADRKTVRDLQRTK